ncbi:MAG TPA: hypothetical protein VGS19_29425 [Streptosporangiaceae bacterium]|nr:hypothetical protein [Streptosporangiaceae bacterium]
MRPRARALAIVASLAVVVGGCSAAAHLQALQPPPPHLPPPPPPIPAPVAAPRVQLGVDLDAYSYRGQNVVAAARADVAYIRSLHANSVMISFPFFTDGPGNAVHATETTPSPQALGTVIMAAEQARLYVLVRPLLDERTLGRARAGFAPPSPGPWFASYLKFLLPYAEVAQKLHVPEFAVGAELSSIQTAPDWNHLDNALRRHYHGQLFFTLNTATQAVHAGGTHALNTVDAYPPVSASHLTAGWEKYDRALLPHTVLTEVGIAAVRGADVQPWHWHWDVTTLDQAVQTQWFTAACHAAKVTHLGGIYFWSMPLSAPVTPGPTQAYQGAWAYGAGATAVGNCFAWIGGGRQA